MRKAVDKVAKAAYDKAYKIKRKAELSVLGKRWYEHNKIRKQQKAKVWEQENKDKAAARHKRYADKFPEKRRALYIGRSSTVAGRNAMRAARGLPAPTRPEPEKCECCGGPQTNGRSIALDHSHVTGKFRGWLCNPCNLAIGMLGDTIDGVRRAVRYLETHE